MKRPVAFLSLIALGARQVFGGAVDSSVPNWTQGIERMLSCIEWDVDHLGVPIIIPQFLCPKKKQDTFNSMLYPKQKPQAVQSNPPTNQQQTQTMSSFLGLNGATTSANVTPPLSSFPSTTAILPMQSQLVPPGTVQNALNFGSTNPGPALNTSQTPNNMPGNFSNPGYFNGSMTPSPTNITMPSNPPAVSAIQPNQAPASPLLSSDLLSAMG